MYYRYRVKSFPLSFVRAIFLGGKYRAGFFNQGEELTRFRDLLHGYGGGLYLDTKYLGPISLEFGGTDQKDFNFYLSMGYKF